jgi:hypothetical protein
MAIPNGTRFIGISQKVDLTERKSTFLNSLTEPYTIEDIRTSAGTDSVYDNLIAQGTDENTTLVLDYGVNIITTSTTQDYAAKLPQPVTGRSVKVVNTSGLAVSIYPSNIGGQINDLPIDQPALVPADGKLYTFTCIENPLPGQWSVALPSNIIMEVGTLDISHTNGVDSIVYGSNTAVTPLSPPAVISQDPSGSVTIANPTQWMSLNSAATIVRAGYYTNILPSDVAGPSPIQIERNQFGGQTQSSSFTIVGKELAEFYPVPSPPSFSVVGAGGTTIQTPAEIGNVGTYAGLTPVTSGYANDLMLGDSNGTIFTNYWNIWKVTIPASAATKTYSIQIFLEYQLIS